MQVKIRDWDVGKAEYRTGLSASRMLELEDLVVKKLMADGLPASVFVLSVSVDVILHHGREVGEPVPFDAQMFSYHIDVKVPKKGDPYPIELTEEGK